MSDASIIIFYSLFGFDFNPERILYFPYLCLCFVYGVNLSNSILKESSFKWVKYGSRGTIFLNSVATVLLFGIPFIGAILNSLLLFFIYCLAGYIPALILDYILPGHDFIGSAERIMELEFFIFSSFIMIGGLLMGKVSDFEKENSRLNDEIIDLRKKINNKSTDP